MQGARLSSSIARRAGGSGGCSSHLLILGPAKPGYFSSPSRMPGALIEPLFITDPSEASLAASSRGQEAIARGLLDAVEQYFSESRRSA
jgi:hypothetical protein